MQVEIENLKKAISYLSTLPGMKGLSEHSVLGSLQAYQNNEQVSSSSAPRGFFMKLSVLTPDQR
jgi:hypothetical protein